MKRTKDSWVYVVVQNPGGDEQIAGQHDREHDVAFIPAFLQKEAAQQGLLSMARVKGMRYEVQAILFEDLIQYTLRESCCIFVLDDSGTILERYAPDGIPL